MKSVCVLALLVVVSMGYARAQPVGNAPELLSWERTEIEAKTSTDNRRQVFEFSFRNATDSTVTIVAMVPDCACTVTELTKKQFSPGERGKLRVAIDEKGSASEGTKNIDVIASDGKIEVRQTLRMLLKVHIQPEKRSAFGF